MWSADSQKREEGDEEDSEEESSEEESEEEGGPSNAAAAAAAEANREDRKAQKKARKEAALAKQRARNVEVGDMPSSDDDDESDDDMPANPNHSKASRNMTKAPSGDDVDEITQGVQDLKAPASRREREALAAAEAKEKYMRLHAAGKTDEAKADLARLKVIREQRAAEAARRQVRARLYTRVRTRTVALLTTSVRRLKRKRRRSRKRPARQRLRPRRPRSARPRPGPRSLARRNKAATAVELRDGCGFTFGYWSRDCSRSRHHRSISKCIGACTASCPPRQLTALHGTSTLNLHRTIVSSIHYSMGGCIELCVFRSASCCPAPMPGSAGFPSRKNRPSHPRRYRQLTADCSVAPSGRCGMLGQPRTGTRAPHILSSPGRKPGCCEKNPQPGPKKIRRQSSVHRPPSTITNAPTELQLHIPPSASRPSFVTLNGRSPREAGSATAVTFSDMAEASLQVRHAHRGTPLRTGVCFHG